MGIFLFYNIISLVVLYVTGSILIAGTVINPEKQYTRLFTKLLAAIIFYVFIFSLIKTGGNTVNLGFLILLIPMVLNRSLISFQGMGELKNYFKISKKTLLTTASLLIAVFALCYWFITDSASLFPVVPNGDYVYYSRISDYLNRFGIESGVPDYLQLNQNKPGPYHYFELWFNALIIFCTGSLAIVSQQLGCHVILNLLICIGFLAIAEHYSKIGLSEIIFSFFLLFFNGLIFLYYPEKILHHHHSMFLTNVITSQKSAVVYLFLIGSILLIINRKQVAAIYLLLCLPIVSITTAPAVFLAVILFLLVSYISGAHSINYFRNGLAVFSLITFIVVFYLLNKNLAVITSFSGISDILKIQNESQFTVLNFINIIGKSVLQLVYIFMPFVLLVLLFNKTIIAQFKKYPEFILFVLLTLISMISWSALNPMVDSIQLFSNLSVPLVNLLFFILFHFIFIKNTKKPVAILLSFFFIIWTGINIKNTIVSITKAKNEFIQAYSGDYLSKVASQLKEGRNIGAIIFSQEDLKGFLGKKLDVYAYRNYLSFVSNGMDILSLNEKSEIPLSPNPALRAQEQQVIKTLHFQQFIEEQNQNKSFVNINQSRIDFIDANHISYLFLTKGTSIDSVFDKKIKNRYSDTVSGETFLIFNK